MVYQISNLGVKFLACPTTGPAPGFWSQIFPNSKDQQVHDVAVGGDWRRKHLLWYGVPSRRCNTCLSGTNSFLFLVWTAEPKFPDYGNSVVLRQLTLWGTWDWRSWSTALTGGWHFSSYPKSLISEKPHVNKISSMYDILKPASFVPSSMYDIFKPASFVPE